MIQDTDVQFQLYEINNKGYNGTKIDDNADKAQNYDFYKQI